MTMVNSGLKELNIIGSHITGCGNQIPDTRDVMLNDHNLALIRFGISMHGLIS